MVAPEAGSGPGAQGKGGRGDDPWAGRVAIGRSGGRSFAYRPDHLLVSRGPWERLPRALRAKLLAAIGGAAPAEVTKSDKRGPILITGVADPISAAARLSDEGLVAQVDHVFFATPADRPVSGAPVVASGVGGAPVMFGGVGGAPVMFGGAPGLGGPGWDCGCCRSDFGPSTGPATAPRRSTVTKASPPLQPALPAFRPGGDIVCRAVVLDTGLAAEAFMPDVQATSLGGTRDEPDGDADGHLDAAAGHGTFIAAIIERMAPQATVGVHQVLSTFGEGADSDVAAALWTLVENPPQVVNLSFAGYTADDTTPLAIRLPLGELVAAGVAVIAAAGNDATCRPAWPASADGVVAVAALGPHGPAWFTNHGPWVRACAPGVDVVSRFFHAPLKPNQAQRVDIQALDGIVEWATWSGSSFAAPIVAGVVARSIVAGRNAAAALAAVVDDPALFRLPGLGTVINERPW